MVEIWLDSLSAKNQIPVAGTIGAYWYPDTGKSTSPRSSTGKNSGGPMKTFIVTVQLSSKKIL